MTRRRWGPRCPTNTYCSARIAGGGPARTKWRRLGKTAPRTLEILWHWLENPTINRGNLHLDSEADAIAEVRDLPALGVGTLLELTNVGLRPNHEGYRRIARATGLNVVAGCGYYIADSLSEQTRELSVEEMCDAIVRDIEVGFEGTNIRAGIIGEVGLSWPIDPVEERSLEASVIAMKRTGAALTLHSPYFLRDVSVLQEICDRLTDLRADMSRVIMGHCDSFARDPRFLDVAPGLGCLLEFDMFGTVGYEHATGFVYPSEEVRVEAIHGLMQDGHADRVLMSHDVALKTIYQKYGGHGYGYVSRVIGPWLRRLGVTEDQLNQVMSENAKRVIPIGIEDDRKAVSAATASRDL